MKKWHVISSVMLVAVVVAGYALAAYSPVKVDDSYNTKGAAGIQLQEYKRDEAIITKERAINAVMADFPELADKQLVSVDVKAMTFGGYSMFTEEALNKNPELKERGYLENTPVYIVEFDGVQISRSGGTFVSDEKREADVLTKQFVIVDAKTGVTLLTYHAKTATMD
ncbi:MAG: hypothetical protein LBL34_03650 [Clostridiales bacterium]|jgi:hypothetical protein|nr:hypothetical protein [Clostridiales bacterium]